MKQKLIKWSTALMTSCMGLGTLFSCDFASLLLFGEYPYPQDEDNEE